MLKLGASSETVLECGRNHNSYEFSGYAFFV